MAIDSVPEIIKLRESLTNALEGVNIDSELHDNSIVVKKKHVGKIIFYPFSAYDRIHILITRWHKTPCGGLEKGQETRIDPPDPSGDQASTIDALVKACTEFINHPPILKTKSKEPDIREQLIQNLIARLIIEKCGGKIHKLAADDGDVVNMTHPWISRIRVSTEWVQIAWAKPTGYWQSVHIRYNKYTVDPTKIVNSLSAALGKVNTLSANLNQTLKELENESC